MRVILRPSVLEDRTLPSTISFIQPLGTVAGPGSSPTSLDLVATGNVAAGHDIVLEFVMRPAAGNPSAFAHLPGDSTHLVDFHLDADATNAQPVGGNAGAVRTVLFSAMGVPALPAGAIITITSPATDGRAASAAEFRGLSADRPLDQFAFATGLTPAVTSGVAPVSHQANDLLVGAIGVAGSISHTSPGDSTHDLGFTAGNGYTVWPGAASLDHTAKSRNVQVHPEYRTVNVRAGYQADGTLEGSATGPWANLLAEYRADPTDHFRISAPSTIESGRPFVVTVSAQDAANNVATGYTGTVHFTSSDTASGVVLPGDLTFTPADHGVRQVTVTLVSDGLRSITATDTENVPVLNGSASVLVHPAGFTVNVPVLATAGQPFTSAVVARRFDGSVDISYAGTVHFGSSDGNASLPADAALSGGAGTFAVTLRTAGNQTVSATDTFDPSITGSGVVMVSAAAATHFAVTAPATTTAGVPFSVVLTAQDQFNNVATGYRGMVHFTSSDSASGSSVPADYVFTGADNAVHSFNNGVTFITAGNQTVTAQDTSNGSITGSAFVAVSAAAATHFAVSAPASATAGVPFTVLVTALDQFNNAAVGYFGTVHFSSSDGGATVPSNVALSGGTGTFAVTLRTAGAQALTVTDASDGSKTGSAFVMVSAAAATHFAVTAPATSTAGVPFSVFVTAQDQFNNVATSYRGTAHFTSSDSASGTTVPADYPFVAGDNGVHVFSSGVTFVTAGNETITARDTSNSSVTGSAIVTVSAASATHLGVSAPATTTAGVPFTVLVTALDQFNNAAISYGGTFHFSSSDAGATVPSDASLSGGIGTFAVTLRTAGAQTVTVTDTSNSSITGSAFVAVSAAPATHFGVSAPATATAGVPFTVLVTALDQFNNAAVGYGGTVHFSSSDVGATVPPDVALSGGTGTFAVTMRMAGAQALTVTDTSDGSKTGSAFVIVSAAAATHFAVTAPATATAGVPFSVVVTAQDQFNNVATSYRGTAHFTSSDGGSGATVPGDYPFVTSDNGVHVFSNGVTFATAGNQTVTTTDAIASITGTSNPAMVRPADFPLTAGRFTPPNAVVGDPIINEPVFHFTDADPAPRIEDFVATVTWGDGTITDNVDDPSAVQVMLSGDGFDVLGSHTYLAGAFGLTFAVEVHDIGGAPPVGNSTMIAASPEAIVSGTNGADTLTVSRIPGMPDGTVTYVLNGGAPVTLSHIFSFTFHGFGGDDSMTVDRINVNDRVLTGFSFDGGAGINALTIHAAGVPVQTPPGSVTAGIQRITYVNVAQTFIDDAAGVNALAGPDTADRATAFTGLSPAERAVQALYLDALGRAGSPAELDLWVSLLPASATSLSMTVVNAIENSAEARDHLVRSWYMSYLGRQAIGGEEQPFVQHLASGATEEQVLSLLLGSSEFQARALGGQSPDGGFAFVEALFADLLGRSPSGIELPQFVTAVSQVGYSGVALAILESQEFRIIQFEGYYNALLHRPISMTDPGLNTLVASALDIRSVRFVFETSAEFFANG